MSFASLRARLGATARSYVGIGLGAATTNIPDAPAGSKCIIWAFWCKCPGSNQSATLETRGGTAKWRGGFAINVEWSTEGFGMGFPMPITSNDGLRVVTTGAGNDVCVAFSVWDSDKQEWS